VLDEDDGRGERRSRERHAAPVSGDGFGIVGATLTGRWNSRIGHSRSSAIVRRSFSGFTATGLPTASSIGRSVIESE